MNVSTITNDERNEINRLIDQFIAGNIADPIPQRSKSEINAVAQSNVLPALEDWSAFGGITRDCKIVWVDRDPPFNVRPIDDARISRFVLIEASTRHPSLASLRPKRPQDAHDCDHCGGTGRTSFGIGEEAIQIGGRERCDRVFEDQILCYCAGLGWLLEGES